MLADDCLNLTVANLDKNLEVLFTTHATCYLFSSWEVGHSIELVSKTNYSFSGLFIAS